MPFNFKINKALSEFEKYITKDFLYFSISRERAPLGKVGINKESTIIGLRFNFYNVDSNPEVSISVSNECSRLCLEKICETLYKNEYFKEHYIEVVPSNEKTLLVNKPDGILIKLQINSQIDFLNGKKLNTLTLIEPTERDYHYGNFSGGCAHFLMSNSYFIKHISFQTLQRISNYLNKYFPESRTAEYISNSLKENADVELKQLKYQKDMLERIITRLESESEKNINWENLTEEERERYKLVLDSRIQIRKKIESLPDDRRLIFETL